MPVAARARAGFTLVELLITILIVGILAAVGLAAYSGQKDKARDARSSSSRSGCAPRRASTARGRASPRRGSTPHSTERRRHSVPRQAPASPRARSKPSGSPRTSSPCVHSPPQVVSSCLPTTRPTPAVPERIRLASQKILRTAPGGDQAPRTSTTSAARNRPKAGQAPRESRGVQSGGRTRR